MPTSSHPQRSAAIQVLVFLAGFTFLVHEVSWNRLLALVLGSTVVAGTLVLSAFMTGFGLGAWYWGRLANSRRRVGRLLALLLIGIGLASGVSELLIARLVTGLAGVTAWAVALLLLAGPAFLMGGVFPLAAKVAVGQGGDPARVLGRLYAVETLGSALGGLTAGYVMLGTLGQQTTMLTAVVANLVIAGWLLAGRRFDAVVPLTVPATSPATGPTRAEKRREGSRRAPDPVAVRHTALLGAFICGLAMLVLQVIWLRALRVYLINTSYTFALVSSLVILGLFAGSAWCGRRGAGDDQRALVGALSLLAAFIGLGLVVLARLPELVMFPLQGAFASPVARVVLLPLTASLLIVVPPAICSGFVFPLACSMAAAGREGVSRDVGQVLMVNTAGAALGPLLGAFLLLPAVGIVRSILVVLAVVLAAVAMILLRWRPAGGPALPRYGAVAATLAVAVLVVLGPQVRILPPSFHNHDRELLFYLESRDGTLAVGRDRTTRARALHTYVDNAAVIGSTYDAIKVVKMVGHFPFFLGLDARDVLVVGFGIGVTTSAIAAHPEVETIDCVELVPGLRDAAVFYRDVNREVARDPRLTIIAGDGRHFLQTTDRTYDLISCDPTHPILGSGGLYTRDYFEHCRAHLNPGGMVSQYLPLHKLGNAEFLGLLRTFQAVFPECTVWLGHYHAVLLGSLEPLAVDYADWQARVASLPADPHFLLDPPHLAATLVLDGETIGELGATSPLNTDDRCYTEFFDLSCLDEDNLARNLRFLQDNRVGLDTVFGDVSDRPELARHVRGNVLLTESLLHQFAGEERKSLDALRRAGEAVPEDQEYPFLIKLYFQAADR